MKQHSIGDIIKDTLDKFKIGKQGNILVLIPNTDEEDIILVSRDAGLTISMYKKPKCKEGWKVTDVYTPITITTNNILNETPEKFELKKDNAIATFPDGTKVTVSINKSPSSATLEEVSRGIIALPDKMDVSLEVTPFSTHGQTESISAYGGRVLVGNQNIFVRYKSSKTGEIKVANKDVMKMIKSLGKNTGGTVHLSSNDKNMIVSTNDKSISDPTDKPHVYMICSSYSSRESIPAKQTVEGTEKMMDANGTILIKSSSGIRGLTESMKSVIQKYAGGTSAFLHVSLNKDEFKISIEDVQTKVEKKLDVSKYKVELDKDHTYPHIMMVTISVARYLMDLSDNIKEIKTYTEGKRTVIVLTTDKESVIFAT